MENEKKMTDEELELVSGGNIFGDAWDWFCDTFTGNGAAGNFVHDNCGGHINCEDHGTYHCDIWLTCSKCGKTWHPHNPNNVSKCDGVRKV